MNRPTINSTQRFSVNSSLSTLKNCQQPHHQNTSTKNKQSKRFSYQEAHDHGSSFQKENLRNNFALGPACTCLNHSNKQAQYVALESSNEPMHLCERCAILVASKGFQIKKIREKSVSKVGISGNELKKQINSSFAGIKERRKKTLQKL